MPAEIDQATTDAIANAIDDEDAPTLEKIAALHPAFAEDPDWIRLAVGWGRAVSVRWLIDHGAPVRIEADDGFPLLHIAIDLAQPMRLTLLRMLIAAGADIHERGINDWTPLHRAAIMADEATMAFLIAAGADRDARTRIDDCATAEEEARNLGRHAAADFIRDYRPDG